MCIFILMKSPHSQFCYFPGGLNKETQEHIIEMSDQSKGRDRFAHLWPSYMKRKHRSSDWTFFCQACRTACVSVKPYSAVII